MPDERELARARAYLLQTSGGPLSSGPPNASATIPLPLSENPLRAAAILIATVLYPNPPDAAERWSAERAIAFELMKLSGSKQPVTLHPAPTRQCALDGTDAERHLRVEEAWRILRSTLPHPAPGILSEALAQSEKQRNKTIRNAKTPWKRRMSGAKMAWLLIIDQIIRSNPDVAGRASIPPQLQPLVSPAEWERLVESRSVGVNEAIERYGEIGGNRSLWAARERSYANSFPVFHVAIGIDRLLSYAGGPPSTAPESFGTLLRYAAATPDFTAALLALASAVANLIALTPALNQASRALVRFDAI